MATFTAGSTTTITLDYNDSLTVVGKADALVAPSVGSAFRTALTGTQVLGPFKVTSTTVVLTALSDGSYTSSSDTRGDVPLTTDELIATKALVSGGGIDKSLRPILVMGGDHPDNQYWGSNGSNGLAQMYLDQGIKPYIAICADESTDSGSGYGATCGKPGMLTYEQARVLQAKGVEFANHAARHLDAWELANTGVRIFYTGAATSPTVNITTTQVDLAHSGGTSSVTFASAPTISALVAAIAAAPGWTCLPATELTGAEPSSALMPLVAVRSVVDLGDATDSTDSNQRFALSGGILLRYAGYAYADVNASFDGQFFSIYADGVRLAAINTFSAGTDSLTEVVAAINALAIADLTALVMDNGYNLQQPTALNPGQKKRETYCLGDEKATSLPVLSFVPVAVYGAHFCGGIGYAQTARRLVECTKERASAEGLELAAFAQPGGRLASWMIRSVADEHVSWRGNRDSGLTPHAHVANRVGKFTGHYTSLTAWTEDETKAMLYALADSPGFTMDWLNHFCTPTPLDPSGYFLNTHSNGNYSSADQDEGPFFRALKLAAQLRDADLISILPPSKAAQARARLQSPPNLFFNPKFRSGRSGNLNAINTAAQGAAGLAVPGWALSTAPGDFTTVSITDGVMRLITNGALASDQAPIAHVLLLEPGRTYDIGATLNLRGLAAGKNVRFKLEPVSAGLGNQFAPAQKIVNSTNWNTGFWGDANFCFTAPAKKGPMPARVISLAGPWDLSSGNTIKVNYDSVGATADITLTGAAPTAVTAREVADAINAAVKASALYAGRGEYHACARADNNKLVIELPRLVAAGNGSAQAIDVINGTGGTKLTTIFGGSAVRAASRLHAEFDTGVLGWRLSLVMPLGCQGEVTIQAPYARELRN